MKTVFFHCLFLLFLLGSPLDLFCHDAVSPLDTMPAIVREAVEEHLIPQEHRVKKALDKLFSKSRFINSIKKMKKAGFKVIKRQPSGMVVARHSEIKGYVIKTFLDGEPIPDWLCFAKRAEGANLIREWIANNNGGSYLKVPKKWLYIIPEYSRKKEGIYYMGFLLVAQDMKPLGSRANRQAFYKRPNEQTVQLLHDILLQNRLIDSIYIDNIPYCDDGKIAFLDTEHYQTNRKRVKLELLIRFFSPSMQNRWRQLPME